MSPAWSLQGGSGGGTPPVPITAPSSEGLVLWLKGDVGLQSTAGVASAWLDQSGFGQDFASQPPLNPGPFVGLDTLDGIPCVTFPLDGGFGPNPLRGLFRSGLVNRSGDFFGYGVGENQPITILSVMIPRFSAAVFNITGGIDMEMGSTPARQPLFDLEDTVHVDGFYLYSTAWRNPSSGTNDGPDTPGGAGGPYNNTPTLAAWFQGNFPTVAAQINGVPTTLTPTTIPGATGPSLNHACSIGRQSSGGFNFFGAMAERLIYDFDLRTAPDQLYTTMAYLEGRYPSIPIVVA